MTTFSAVTNSEIAVGAPITNNLKTKERDNLLAIQENDPTAPTIAYATTAGSAASATTAGTITNQGVLATLDSVSAGQIDANSVFVSEINTAIGTYGTVQLGTAGTFTTNGYWVMSCPTDDISLEYQAFINGVWVKIYDLTSAQSLQWIISGSFRIWNSTGFFRTLTYQKYIG